MRALLAALVVVTGNALADSDTYFCTGPGYLAYELREWSAPEKRHVLKIVFVGGADGISAPVSVPLEDFQLHGMKCEAEWIEILGWERKYGLSVQERRITSAEPRQAGAPPKEYVVESFTGTRRTRTIAIPSAHPQRRYVLRIAYRQNPVASGLIHHETTATLLERDAAGKVLRREPVHEGVAKETVD